MKRLMVFAFCAIVMGAALAAQEKPATVNSGTIDPAVAALVAPKAPTLTTEQKQAVTILAQRIEIAQLRAQQAQAEFEAARKEIAGLVQSLQVPGFDLDLATMVYTKKPEPKKDEPKE